MKGILTVTIKEDSKVQKIIDNLIIYLQLSKVVPLPKNTILQDGPRYTLQFYTNLSQEELSAQIKNHSQIEGLNIQCKILDFESLSFQSTVNNTEANCQKKQYSKKSNEYQKDLIIEQLQFIQSFQDFDQDSKQIGRLINDPDQMHSGLSEIKSDDQFEILQEPDKMKESKSSVKIQKQIKKQIHENEERTISKQQKLKNQSKQEVIKLQTQQQKQKFQFSKEQQKKQTSEQSQQLENDQSSVDAIFKYFSGKDDYSTIIKLVSQHQAQEQISDLIHQNLLNKAINQQNKELKQEKSIQKQNSSGLINRSTASGLDSIQDQNIQLQMQCENAYNKKNQVVKEQKEICLKVQNQQSILIESQAIKLSHLKENEKKQVHLEVNDSTKNQIYKQSLQKVVQCKQDSVKSPLQEKNITQPLQNRYNLSTICKYSFFIGTTVAAAYVGMYLLL